jgi:non-heme chloroperoxidase
MSTITTNDGTTIYYKDWGSGQPMVFSHGWPLSSDDWDAQMQFFGEHGFRCIAHDRRGHGRSAQTWHGNDMDTYADDLMALVEALDLKNAIHVGHSTGGGEVARYIGRHGGLSRGAGSASSGQRRAVLREACQTGGRVSGRDDQRARCGPAGSWQWSHAITAGDH